MNKIPYPFKDNSADFILMSHVLEHLDNIPDVMDELYRILKTGGELKIVCPYYRSRQAFTDLTHRRFFTEKSLDYFIEGTKYRGRYAYTKNSFKLVYKKIYREGFPLWHLKKYLGIDLKLPIFPNTVEWLLVKSK